MLAGSHKDTYQTWAQHSADIGQASVYYALVTDTKLFDRILSVLQSLFFSLWGLSDPRIAELRKMPQSFIIKLYSETQVSGRLGGVDMPRTPYRASEGKRSQ